MVRRRHPRVQVCGAVPREGIGVDPLGPRGGHAAPRGRPERRRDGPGERARPPRRVESPDTRGHERRGAPRERDAEPAEVHRQRQLPAQCARRVTAPVPEVRGTERRAELVQGGIRVGPRAWARVQPPDLLHVREVREDECPRHPVGSGPRAAAPLHLRDDPPDRLHHAVAEAAADRAVHALSICGVCHLHAEDPHGGDHAPGGRRVRTVSRRITAREDRVPQRLQDTVRDLH